MNRTVRLLVLLESVNHLLTCYTARSAYPSALAAVL